MPGSGSGKTPDDAMYVAVVSGGGGGGGGTSDATAANQTTEIARLTSLNTVAGTTGDAAYTSGSGSLVAILKGIYGVLATAFGALPTTTDRSGTATTTSGGLTVPANTARRALVGQNISTVVIGFNEQGGTAAIGSAGTYTVAAGASFSISSNKAVNFIAQTGTAAVTMTES